MSFTVLYLIYSFSDLATGKFVQDYDNIAVVFFLAECKEKCKVYICDRISHNKASTHTKSNLRFYQKWIAGLIHYPGADPGGVDGVASHPPPPPPPPPEGD